MHDAPSSTRTRLVCGGFLSLPPSPGDFTVRCSALFTPAHSCTTALFARPRPCNTPRASSTHPLIRRLTGPNLACLPCCAGLRVARRTLSISKLADTVPICSFQEFHGSPHTQQTLPLFISFPTGGCSPCRTPPMPPQTPCRDRLLPQLTRPMPMPMPSPGRQEPRC